MAIFKVLSTDTVEDAFINKYNPTTDEIITSISRVGNIFTFTKEGGGTIQGVLLPEQDGKISGLLVSTGVNNLTFDVTAGTYNIADELHSYAGGSFLLTDGDATNDRIDVAVVNDAGALAVKIGTPAATPIPPTINADEIAVASFIVKANATTASSGDVFVNVVDPLPTDGAYIPSNSIAKPIENPGGAENLPELNDVTFAGLTATQLLKYDGANWVNAFAKIAELSDVDLTGIAANRVLKWTGASWIVTEYKISKLDDANVTAPADGHLLVYQSGIWKNLGTIPLASFTGKFILNKIITPATITSNEDDYNPTDLNVANVYRLSGDAPNRQIRGIVAQEHGRQIVLINVGANSIRLIDESASSSAVNRFALKGNLDIEADEAITIIYDNTSQRWRALNI